MSESIGGRIRALREARNWSRVELARRIGGKNARAALYLWEAGKRTPSLESIERLAGIFGCKVSDIDPLGEAWTSERPRVSRLKKHVPPLLHEAAPPQSPSGVAMGPGDQGFSYVEGAWKMLRSDEERQAFILLVRGFVHDLTAPEPVRKKAAR